MGGIAKYIDALDCREQEIASLRQQNNTLKKALQVVEASLSRFHPEHQASAAPALDCLDACKRELKAFDGLVVVFAGCGQRAAGRKEKIKSQGKKLLYPLNRPKLQQLESKLRNANATFQLALQALSL